MSTKYLDCRDLDCPIPVLKTKEALESFDEGILDIELNTYSSIENVKRFLNSQGLFFQEKKLAPKHIILSVVKGYECGLEPENKESNEEIFKAQQIAQKAKEAKENRSLYAILFGGIISAILASTCCLGPLLFLLFGVSAGSLSFLKVFAPYHNYFTAGAVIVVSYLWWDYWKKRRNKVACGTALCKNYFLYLLIGTLFVAIMLTYPWWIYYFIE